MSLTLAETQLERDRFLEKMPERTDVKLSVEMPTAADAFMSMMTGSLWQERSKQAQEAIRQRTQLSMDSEVERRRRRKNKEDD